MLDGEGKVGLWGGRLEGDESVEGVVDDGCGHSWVGEVLVVMAFSRLEVGLLHDVEVVSPLDLLVGMVEEVPRRKTLLPLPCQLKFQLV